MPAKGKHQIFDAMLFPKVSEFKSLEEAENWLDGWNLKKEVLDRGKFIEYLFVNGVIEEEKARKELLDKFNGWFNGKETKRRKNKKAPVFIEKFDEDDD